MSDMRDIIRNTIEGIEVVLGRLRVGKIDRATDNAIAHDVIGRQPHTIEAVGLGAIEATMADIATTPESTYATQVHGNVVSAIETPAEYANTSTPGNLVSEAELEQRRLLKQSRQEADAIYEVEPPIIEEIAA